VMVEATARRPIGPHPTERVGVPVMYQSWNLITFLHWHYDPAEVQRRLPSGMEVETFEGSAWVGMTPFLLEHLRAPGVPALPWLSRFPETNVRTYVRGPDGRVGIWFFSLDTPRLAAVLAARATYFLPYNWGYLDLRRDGARIRYRGRRWWPNGGAGYEVTVELGAPFDDADLSELDHYLTARWVLFTRYGPVAASASAEHPPWPLRRARVLEVRQDLISGVGLPEPHGEPLVHFSIGVDTRISAPRLIRPARAR
jgi:uncharacterized protein